jgi:beta-1,4-N-acetylglucosaminyltransferase
VIFGTVGTHTAPFDRLVRALDALAAGTDEEVVVQWGASRYRPRAATGFAVASGERFDGFMRDARVIVTHGGDTVLEAIELGVPVIVVPRRQAYHEHIDDHQVELARALAARDLVTWSEPDGLAEAVARARPAAARANPGPLIDAVRSAIRADRRAGRPSGGRRVSP